MRRYIAILSVVIGIAMLFLVGCKKSSCDTIAFVGDESEMMSCYDIYPQQYFPYHDQKYDSLVFPPDITGEYEMNSVFVECTYEFYNGSYYFPITVMNPKTVYIIIEEQVNAMAKIKFATKKNGKYSNWHEADAYLYGDVFDESIGNDFLICYEYTENAGDFKYIRGEMIKGTIGQDGMSNIHRWSIIKNRSPKENKPMIYNYFGYEHYRADVAPRQ